MTSKALSTLLAALSVGLLATACGDDGGGTGSASETGTATDPTTDTPTTTAPSTSATTMNMTMTSTPDTETTDEPTTDEPTTDEPTSTTEVPGDVVAFRFASMDVRDPHFLATTLIGCQDVTDMAPLGMPGVNDQFNEAIAMDTDADMFLDLSLLLLFRGEGLDQTDGGGGDLDFANGQCNIPLDNTVCDIRPNSELQPSMYTSQAAGVCHEADPTHLSSEGYDPAPGVTNGPCFHAGPSDVTIVTTSFELPLVGAEIAATFEGDPATSLMSGTLRGFLTVDVAEATMLPKELAADAGVDTVAGLMPGHETCCAAWDDLDDNGGTPGWWFYVDFTAVQVPWTGE